MRLIYLVFFFLLSLFSCSIPAYAQYESTYQPAYQGSYQTGYTGSYTGTYTGAYTGAYPPTAFNQYNPVPSCAGPNSPQVYVAWQGASNADNYVVEVHNLTLGGITWAGYVGNVTSVYLGPGHGIYTGHSYGFRIMATNPSYRYASGTYSNGGVTSNAWIQTIGPNCAPPATPVLNAVTAKSCSGASAIQYVSWYQSTTTNTTSYELYRADPATSTGYRPVTPAGYTGQAFWDTLPQNNQPYYYFVYAYGPYGYTYSAQVYAGLSANCVTPAISAAPSCKGAGLNTPAIDVSWYDPVPNLQYFLLLRAPYGYGWSAYYYAPGNVTSYSDQSITPPGQYQYYIHSYNNENYPSPASTSTGLVTAPWCDYQPPNIAFVSGQNGTPIGCFDQNMIWPRTFDLAITDTPPPAFPAGVNLSTIQGGLYNRTTGTSVSVPGAPTTLTSLGGNNWRYTLNQSLLTLNNIYRLNISAQDNASPPNSKLIYYDFTYQISCTDWIQTTGGNVHSEGTINTPGGP